MLLLGFGFARRSAAFSHADSVHAFLDKMLGPDAGFVATWMLLGTYIVFPPVSVLGMTAFKQAFLRHTGIVTGADGLPIALVSWALVWLGNGWRPYLALCTSGWVSGHHPPKPVHPGDVPGGVRSANSATREAFADSPA